VNSKNQEPEMLKGRCECGTVKFEIESEIQALSHCHCSMCRRLHGAAFATFATVDRRAFRLLSGELQLTHYSSSANVVRTFCSECGSTLIADAVEDESVRYVSMGALEGDLSHPPAVHEFVTSKADWYEIVDDGLQYEKSSP
jgi:hypothetical protein